MRRERETNNNGDGKKARSFAVKYNLHLASASRDKAVQSE